MNRLKYLMKYSEYLIKVVRAAVLSDEKFHTKRLKTLLNRHPDIINPKSFTEKLCHRLIYDHNPIYTILADKLAVRRYVYEKTNKLHLTPVIGTYRRAKDIDFSTLPNKFVLKCNHDSGSSILFDKTKKSIGKDVLLKLDLAINKNMYYSTREWQYKNITPVIICEEYIDLFSNQNKNTAPEMLRIHCFDGEARFVEADITDEAGNEYINIYDKTWQLLPFQMEYPNSPLFIPEPPMFHMSLSAAQELSNGLDYCRVDLMLQENKIYFSEITLTPRRGKIIITPGKWDVIIGNMWKQNIFRP